MCFSHEQISDTAAGVYAPRTAASCDANHSPDLDSAVVTEELLKRANSELYEIQAQLLSVPRAERKALMARSSQLDVTIARLQKDFAHSNAIMVAAMCLNDSITAQDADEIASALQRLVTTAADITCIDDITLCYLISAGDSVVSAMKQHKEHAGVVKGACHALCSLFSGLKNLDNGDAIAEQLCSLDMGDIVIKGMAHHMSDRDVQLYGCRVINILAVTLNRQDDSIDDCVATACFFASGRIAVAKARRRHPTDKEVTQWADCAMRLI